MAASDDLKSKFWTALASDKVIMLGLDGVDGAHARPMTAVFDGDHGPLWFYTSRDNHLVQRLASGDRAIGTFVASGKSLFATLHGRLCLDTDPSVVKRFWSPFVAAWFTGGQTDPNLVMLRLDLASAEIWADANSMISSIEILLGADPRSVVADKVAKVRMS